MPHSLQAQAVMAGPGLIESLLRYRRLVAMVALVAASAGYGLSSRRPPQYVAVATLVLDDPNSPGVAGDTSYRAVDPQLYLARQGQLMASTRVLQRASRLLGGQQSVDELRAAITVETALDRGSFAIMATAGDPKVAAAMATAVGNAYQQIESERAAEKAQQAIASLDEVKAGLQDELDASLRVSGDTGGPMTLQQQLLLARLTALQERMQEIAVQAAGYGAGVELFEPAGEPAFPTQPKPLLNALLAGAFGLLMAGAYAHWAAGRNQRVEGGDDAASVLGVPLLGEVPECRAHEPSRNGSAPSPWAPGSAAAEAYQFIVASLAYLLADLGASSLMVTGVGPGDGITSTALNIAIAGQRAGRRVVLVDADSRKGRLSAWCGRPKGRGLADLDDEAGRVEDHLCLLKLADGGSVPVLSSGTPPEQSAAFFRSTAFRKTLRRIGEWADLVLIDTPALLRVPDTLAIAGQADGIILVVNHGVTLSDLRSAGERLAIVGTPLIGCVFNRSAASMRSYSRAKGRRPRFARSEREGIPT